MVGYRSSLTWLLLPALAHAAADGGYAGHGLASVSPEVLARYAPPPLAPEVSRRIQNLLDLRAPGGGMPSPDGKRLFFTWTVTGSRQIWRLDGPDRFPVQLTGGEDTTVLLDVSPDGSYLIVSRDRNGEENPGLYWMRPEGGPLELIQHKPGVQTTFQFVSDDSRYVYFRSNDVKPNSYVVYRWDRAHKTREVVFDQEGLWALADVRLDGRMLLSKEVGSNMVEFYEWEPLKKELNPLFGQGEREDYEAFYGAGDEILVRTPRFGEFRRLYRWRAGKFEAISPEQKADVSSFRIDHTRRRILYEVNEDGYTRLHALDARTLEELKLPKLPPADHVMAGLSSRDGRFQVLRLDLGTRPTVNYVLDWTTGDLQQWQANSAPEVDLSTFPRAKLESYPARDGTPIPIWVWRPAKCDAPCPVVIDFHGGPEAQALPGFNIYAQFFLDQGFIFVEPNVRGSEGYGKTWLHADDGPKRLAIITDIEDAAKYARKTWAKDGKAPKVGIIGGSYGGYSALIGMTMFAGAYDAGVSIVGVSNLVTFLQNTAPYRRALRVSEYGDPDTDHDALVKLSPVTYADKVKAPLLIIQGANDPRVPVGEAVQINDSLESRKVPHQLIVFADEGHGAQKRGNQALMYGHALEWMMTYLKPAKR